MLPSSPSPVWRLSASPAAPPPTCSSPLRSASACLAGTPGTRRQKILALRPLLLRSSRHPRQRPRRPFPRALHHPSLRRASDASGPYLRRTIWWPGVLLFLIMVLPWYIEVQRRNPTFYRLFFLEHNLERFATNSLSSTINPSGITSPFFSSALCPGPSWPSGALVDSIEIAIAEWKVRHKPQRYPRPLPRRRRLSRVPRPLGSLSHPLLFLLRLQTSRLHPSLYPAPYHPRRRLPQPHPPRRAPRTGFSGPTPPCADSSSSSSPSPHNT